MNVRVLPNERMSEATQAIYQGDEEPLFNEGAFVRLRRYLHRFTKVSSLPYEGIFISSLAKCGHS